MLTPKKFLQFLIVGLALGNLYTTLHRSGIPLGLDGVITRIEIRHEKHPGVDDVPLIWLGNRAVHLDPEAARELRPGEKIFKRPMESSLQTPRGPVRLHPSRDFKGMAVLMPLIVLLSVL